MIAEIKTYAKDNQVPIIQDAGLDYLLFMVKETNSKTILELGTAIGYSSINMAKLDQEITIVTLERDPKMYEQAKKNIKEEGLEDRIEAVFTDIPAYSTDKVFDFIFVDAGKAHYMDYLNQFIGNLKENGVMFFDNLNFHDMYKDPDAIKNRNTRQLVKKINKFYNSITSNPDYDVEIHREIGDGILILRRRNAV